ncbi:MAG: hypothetical protein ACD_37C00417G0004 [uncultured bacterium]|nr:MAG: hypothetical protein ACD_37C00417G0004 [uncultured bacterium]KKQ57949.1 MAG: hypothetical protein US77_C0014G0011 [Microgenomates group bacterium GW2011_GWC1_38_14]KKR71633.1 MAG: hypothetical protein UU15_C0046G0007 [Candidatus Levybacteria bacterium GW2011_GWC2_40_7]KKR94165.1 MAG: hypothetical protein UU45_C0015G0011 [Candidatus Levybacteria bacterium GW2011_GWA2_41_15]OGH44653.1 MAG: hypothetical protein A3I49_01255 [Candidatus Levybacteria bacterium RIFCSPLOWO2_02_FULL_37_11]
MLAKHLQFRYKNLTILFISVISAIILSRFQPFHDFLLHLGGLGYLGAFLGGILFVWIFTMPTGLLILLTLNETMPSFELAVIAAIGALIGDLTIFKFVKDDLLTEVEDIYNHFGGSHLTHILHSKYFHWTLPVVGALIIASPLPDEVGVSLMGISKMKTYKFILVSLILNFAGIYLVLLAEEAICGFCNNIF